MTDLIRLRPSSAKRWMNCPGSVWLLAKTVDKGSKAADIGTAVHKLIEDKLSDKTFDIDAQKGSKTFEDGMSRPISITAKMIADAKWALDEIDKIKATCGNKIKLYPERFYDINFKGPNGEVVLPGGSVDVTIVDVDNKTLHIIDYKNGTIHVEHVDNPQLMLYAYACLINFKGFRKEDLTKWNVVCTILQPNSRLDDKPKTRSIRFNAQYIKDWFNVTVERCVSEVEISKHVRRAGDHCMFCAKAECGEYQNYESDKTLLDMSDELRDNLFVKVKDITKDDVTKIYDNMKSYEKLLRLVKKEVEENPSHFDYEVVTKEGNSEIVKEIYEQVFTDDSLYKKTPLSQTELKKLVKDGVIQDDDLQRVIRKKTKEVLKKK